MTDRRSPDVALRVFMILGAHVIGIILIVLIITVCTGGPK